MKILFVLGPLGACTLSLLATTGYTYAAQITVPIKGPVPGGSAVYICYLNKPGNTTQVGVHVNAAPGRPVYSVKARAEVVDTFLYLPIATQAKETIFNSTTGGTISFPETKWDYATVSGYASGVAGTTGYQYILGPDKVTCN